MEETLYKKKNGEYFLYSYGGALSKYSQQYGNSTCGGTKIRPLNVEEAMKWVESNLEVEDYETIFGKISEDSSSQFVTFSMTNDNYNKLQQMMSKNDVTLSELLNQIISNY